MLIQENKKGNYSQDVDNFNPYKLYPNNLEGFYCNYLMMKGEKENIPFYQICIMSKEFVSNKDFKLIDTFQTKEIDEVTNFDIYKRVK